MLLRISLGIAILAGLATFYFLQVPVKGRIDELTTNLQTAETERATAQDNERKAKAAETKARSELDTTKKVLDEKSSELDVTKAKLNEQQSRANQLAADLTKTTGERNEAQQELSAWKALGYTPDQIRNLRTQLAKTIEERDAISGENKILLRSNKQLQARLDNYESPEDKDPEMPAGLKGKVLAVDAKWDFVVIDVGGNQGAVERGKLLVSRDGKLIGAVRITRVEPNRSIANIIPEMKQGDLMEGDQVIY
ncbi:MAG: hypothetical protein L0Z50_40445 [Verrucomicrobiales bacterium]|nr:hypothetical protein [Verrucomicrobiales bacterium]